MSKQYPFIILIFLLILINGFLLYSNYSLKRIQSLSEPKVTTSGKLSAILNERVITDSKLGLGFAFAKAVILTKSDGKSHSFKDLYQANERLLFFRFSPPNHCESCVIQSMLQIKEVFGSLAAKKVILLVSGVEGRNLNTILSKFEIASQIFSIDPSVFPEELENKESPFFFEMDKKLKTSDVFLVQYELSHLATDYLKTTLKHL